MAESNASEQQVRANSVQEDDPLLELSRIIGFETPKRHSTLSDPKASAAEPGDLSLDLERELFGTFESEPMAESEPVAQDAGAVHGEADAADEAAPADAGMPSAEAAAEPGSPPAGRAEAPQVDRGSADAPKVPEFLTVRRAGPAPRQDQVSLSRPSPARPANVEPANIEDELARILGGEEPGPRQPLAPPSVPPAVTASRSDARGWHEHAFSRTTSFGAGAPAAQARSAEPQRAAAERSAFSEPKTAGGNPAGGEAREVAADFRAGGDRGETFWNEILPDAEPESSLEPEQTFETWPSDTDSWHFEEDEPKAEPVHHDGLAAGRFGPALDTTQVPERSVEATAPLDLPDFDFAEPAGHSGSLDDLESEFAEVFATLDIERGRPKAHEVAPPADSGEDEFYARAYHQEQNAPRQQESVRLAAFDAPAKASIAPQPPLQSHAPLQSHDGDFDEPRSHALGWGEQQVEESSFDLYDDDLGATSAEEPQPARRRGRGLGLIAVVIAAVVLGAAGVFALSFLGGSSRQTAVVVQADNQPIKVKPSEPGGVTVPNQDKAVYARADGKSAPAPEQKKLVDDTEVPMTLPAPPAAEVKSDARVDPSMADDSAAPAPAEPLTMTPRQVRTVIVKPDGTIVQPEQVDAASQPAAPLAADDAKLQGSGPVIASLQPPAAEQKPLAPVSVPEAAETVLTAPAPTAETTPAPTSIVTPKAASQDGKPASSSIVLDESGSAAASTKPRVPSAADAPIPVAPPVVPSRPANQPMTVIGSTGGNQAETGRQQVASAASAGGYVVQIASQPTAEAAQKTYDSLARRYSQVLAGRGVDIQRADIQGKGTYYRVRIPAASKDEAIAICTQYKAAGGSCYVTH